MGKLHCTGCGKDYWPNGAWQHEKCASGSVPSVEVEKQEPVKGKFDKVAYQREYMRKRRSMKKGGK